MYSFTDSHHLYQIAKEGYYKAQQGFSMQRQNDALVAIVFSAFSLEAFINELGYLAQKSKKLGYDEPFLDGFSTIIDESEKKNTQHKFMTASEALSNKFEKGQSPYQDFANLFRLRDCIVHLKPENGFEIMEDGNFNDIGRELIKKLPQDILMQNTELKSITLLVSTEKAAKWACNIASAMVIKILEMIPESRFRDDNQEILEIYRAAFQWRKN